MKSNILKIKYQLFVFVFALNLMPFHSVAVLKNPKKSKKIKILPVPAIGYSPETKTYIGAVSLLTFDLYSDSITRTSNAKLEFNYTWNKQIVIESDWNYFFKHEKWFTKGRVHFSKYPDLYYGKGIHTPQDNMLSFNSKRTIFDFSVLKNLNHNWFLGPSLKYLNYTNIEFDDNDLFFPELVDNSNTGIGLVILKDSRNSILTPTRGLYFSGKGMQNFSENNYLELTFDFRMYKTMKNNITLATRLFNDFTFGEAPFYDLSMLGGDKYVRGYYLGRYRDNNLSTFQTECRFPVYKRFFMAVFGGLSGLYSSQNPFSINELKANYGAGIRFLVDKSENTFLRIDYALGHNHNNGFYISFGESF